MAPAPINSVTSDAATCPVTNPDTSSTVALEPSLPDREDVIARCELEGTKKNGFAYNDKIWVKYGIDITGAEAAAQEFAQKHVDELIFRVPKVYDWFSNDTKTYIVMERINGITYLEYRKQHPDDEAEVFEAIVKAVRHLWTFRIPPQSNIGPFRGGIPNDRFFSDRGAGRTFKTAKELQDWCNSKLIALDLEHRVDFVSEPLAFCHLDIHPANIIVGADGSLYIIDWGMSGVYPLILEHYGLVHQFRQAFATRLRSTLFSGTTSNLRAVAVVGRIIGQGR